MSGEPEKYPVADHYEPLEFKHPWLDMVNECEERIIAREAEIARLRAAITEALTDRLITGSRLHTLLSNALEPPK